MSDERFARQYRYEPPSEFPLTSPCTGIVHHLSGPNRYAHTQTSLNCLVGCWCKYPNSHFHCAYRFATRILAHMLDSLVRVSRRVGWHHFVSIFIALPAHALGSPVPRRQPGCVRGWLPVNAEQELARFVPQSQARLAARVITCSTQDRSWTTLPPRTRSPTPVTHADRQNRRT